MMFAQTAHARKISVETLQGRKLDLYQSCHALVIGVEGYHHWPQRPGTITETRDISWELKRLGFSVVLLIDPTAEELHEALEQFQQNSGISAERGVVFYYSGHSWTQISSTGEKTGWIIPKDAPLPEKNQQEFKKTAVSSKRIASMADQIQARHLLFLLDAPFAADEFLVEPILLKTVGETNLLPARQFIAAGNNIHLVSKKSEFNRFLLQGLKGEADLIDDDLVSACELSHYLSYRVSNLSPKRHPQSGRIASTTPAGGDFVFQLNRQPLNIARLFVEVQPHNAKIQILNIAPKFEQGMELKPGDYHLHLSAFGYETVEKQIHLAQGESRTVPIALSKEKKMLTNSLGMRFVRIPPGSFIMGSRADEKGRSSDEIPHRVNLNQRYYIQRTEVTVGQFKQFIQSTGYETEAQKGKGCWIAGEANRWVQRPGTSWEKPGAAADETDDGPVGCVSWNDAVHFARWLSEKEKQTYRLPTEAEWEYAIRARTTTPFSAGSCLSTDEANYAELDTHYQLCATVFHQSRRKPTTVGSLAPNPWDLYNMHGNVSEWCLDWYGPYPTGQVTNPKGPDAGMERVIRGGHWQAKASECRSSRRHRIPPGIASDVVGFRLVLLP